MKLSISLIFSFKIFLNLIVFVIRNTFEMQKIGISNDTVN